MPRILIGKLWVKFCSWERYNFVVWVNSKKLFVSFALSCHKIINKSLSTKERVKQKENESVVSLSALVFVAFRDNAKSRKNQHGRKKIRRKVGFFTSCECKAASKEPIGNLQGFQESLRHSGIHWMFWKVKETGVENRHPFEKSFVFAENPIKIHGKMWKSWRKVWKWPSAGFKVYKFWVFLVNFTEI